MKDETLTINQALCLRIKELLRLKNMSQYRLEQNSGISHSQLGFILKDRNNSVNFKTVIMIAEGFGMTLLEFLDSPLFNYEKLEL